MTFNYFGELKKCIKKCYETKETKEINRCKSLCFYRYSQGVNKFPYTPSGHYPSSY